MKNRFDFLPTSIGGLTVLQRKPLKDQRGYLERIFCSDELQTIITRRVIIQINRTYTKKRGTVRGMHFQYPPNSEMKLVSCLKGEIFDVAVDVRQGSPSFLRHHSEILSEANCKTMVIPEGFAHGFQALTDDCELLYLHTAEYSPNSECGLNTEDPLLSIPWPLKITELSTKDLNHSMLTSDFKGVSV
jgi:dTDP-4-dehydrorhamnose 3,5-epimerase